MRTILSISFITLMLLSACRKDSDQNWPILTLKEINGTHVPPNSQTEIVIEFEDGDGDLSEGKIYLFRYRTNIRPIPNPENFDRTDELIKTVPKFPERKNGEILITLGYNEFLDEDPNDSDTMYFKIVAEDKSGNLSDTLTTPVVIAVHPSNE